MNAMSPVTTHPIVRMVTAQDIAAYRRVARAAIGPSPSSARSPAPSPVHPFVLAWSAFDQAVGDISGGTAQAVVHLAQEIRQRRPLCAGERVALDLDVVGARRDPRGVRLALRSTLVGADGAPFAELDTGLLLVGATAPEPFGTLQLPAPAAPSSPTVVAVEVPDDLPERYADVSGDRNPIHLDRDAAQAAGFPGVIAHGMSVLALVCEEAVDRYVGGDAALVTGVGCRFSSPVVPGETLEIVLSPDGDGRAAFTCKTPRGTALKSGWVEWSAP
jgi:acyl dehydratase